MCWDCVNSNRVLDVVGSWREIAIQFLQKKSKCCSSWLRPEQRLAPVDRNGKRLGDRILRRFPPGTRDKPGMGGWAFAADADLDAFLRYRAEGWSGGKVFIVTSRIVDRKHKINRFSHRVRLLDWCYRACQLGGQPGAKPQGEDELSDLQRNQI